jgi:hypothetical protein
MATQKNRSTGYLLPDDADTEDISCLLVFYPDKDEYRRALFGSLDYLGTWTAWQREPERKGIIASRLWKEANEKTRANMDCLALIGTALDRIATAIENQSVQIDVSALEPPLTAISEAIENLELSIPGLGENEMVINNNLCCCGCGCATGCNGGGGDTTLPYDPEILPPPPPGQPPINPDLATKCSLAHYLVYSIRLSLLQAVDHSGNVNDYRSFLVGLLGRIEPLFSGNVLTFELYVWLMQRLNGNTSITGQVAAVFDQHYNSYVCGLFSAENEQEAYNSVLDALDVSLDGMAVLKATAQAIASLMPFQVLFGNAGDYSVPAGFGGRECCGLDYGVINPIPLPSGNSYTLIPIKQGEFSTLPNNNSASLSYAESIREWTHTPLNPGLNYHEVSVTLDIESVLETGLYDSVHGIVFQGIDVSGTSANWKITLNNLVGGASSLPVSPGEAFVYRQNDNPDDEYLDYVNLFPSNVTYGNGAIAHGTLKAGWRSDTYNTQANGWGAMRYRTWLIVKLAGD